MMTSNTSTALITGASRELGLALARVLAIQGWELIVDARGAQALEDARKVLSNLSEVTAIPGDITDASHSRKLAEAADHLGGLDAIINNASILGPSPQLELFDHPLDMFESVFRVNIIAPLRIIQAIQHTLKRGARVINITSDAGVEGYPGWGAMEPARLL